MRKRIRLTENELNRVVEKSVKSILSETHWLTSLNAYDKASDLIDGVDDAIENISDIERFLREYAECVKGAKPMYIKFVGYLDEIFNYLIRKRSQKNNFEDLYNDNFEKQHDGKKFFKYMKDYEDEVIKDDFKGFNDTNDPSGKKREFQDYYEGTSDYNKRSGEYMPDPEYRRRSDKKRYS